MFTGILLQRNKQEIYEINKILKGKKKYFENLIKFPEMINIFEMASKEKKLEILNNHPDLGNKAKISSLTPVSLKEQRDAGLDQCTKEEFVEFKKLNDAYKKFGFPFILAVKGKNKIEILNNFRKRVRSEPKIEFDEALKQVKKIAGLRLEELNNKDI